MKENEGGRSMKLLFTPIQAGALELKNRLAYPPIATAKAEADGAVSRQMVDYYDEKTAGGYLSLVIIEHSFVSMQGKASRNQLSVAEDSAVAGLARLAEAIHKNGSKTAMQINHAGSMAEREITGMEPVGPSGIAPMRKKSAVIPHELTAGEIQSIVSAFAGAARRVKAAGFDGVELHSAHGYLLNQFFSPLSNRRPDAYGGTLANRIRLHMEVIEAVRGAVGRDFPLLLRLGATDDAPGGTSIADSVAAAKAFEQAGVNLLDISGGLCGSALSGDSGQGYFAPFSRAIKENVSIPVLLTGGVTKAQAAEELLKAGKADLIGVGRAIFTDSGWLEREAGELRK